MLATASSAPGVSSEERRGGETQEAGDSDLGL